ncbi:MAG TPA: aminotransferase class V-fold PLP-dependent enzyme [Pyrinomonadaceae bacterium]|nr:aminotransferase class V-fold PLP-dependent enzyme [Pyrinomonadaceae bacterium]
MNRRNFLVNAGVALAASTLTAPVRASDLTSVGTTNIHAVWPAVRNQFDQLSSDHIHLSSFFLVSHPRPVREAIERHRQAIDSNPFVYLEEHMFQMPGKIQASVAEYLGGKPDEVALTNSTTMGLTLVYHGLPLRAGQEILTTTHDHFVHHEAIRLAAARAECSIKKISLFDDIKLVSEGDIVARVRKAITPKTRVVGVTWVHSGTGLKLPIRAIANAIAESNKGRAETDRVLLVVDGVHGFGVEDVNVADLGADFFIAGTHKWIFGPRGTGIVWARAENWKSIRMVFPAFAIETFTAWLSGKSSDAQTSASWITQGGFHAFEYEWALPAAFEFHKQIGRKNIAERIHALNDQCKEGLAAMRHVKLYTPRGDKLSAGLICFEIEGMKSADVVKKLLANRIVASTAPYREGYARVAPSLLNTPEEIDTTLRRIRELA